MIANQSSIQPAAFAIVGTHHREGAAAHCVAPTVEAKAGHLLRGAVAADSRLSEGSAAHRARTRLLRGICVRTCPGSKPMISAQAVTTANDRLDRSLLQGPAKGRTPRTTCHRRNNSVLPCCHGRRHCQTARIALPQRRRVRATGVVKVAHHIVAFGFTPYEPTTPDRRTIAPAPRR